MKYYGGCDVGSTYTKAVILDETGKICADTTIRSKINSETSAKLAMEEVLNKVGLKSSQDLAYLIGTGYGRNKVPFADENISEISCHAMGVHVTDPGVKAIIDIGGQDVKGISIDTDGTVKNFAMNDKCAAGTGRFYEAMARSFEMSLPEFSNLSLTARNVIPITAQCTVFAESEVITLVGEGKPMDEIAAAAGLARREVTAALESVVEPLSLDEPVYTDGGDAMYVIDQVRDPDGEDSWISGLEFRQTVAGLTPREKRIMELRYLKGETQMEVAREIGISQAQVSRLEKAALEQFRHK